MYLKLNTQFDPLTYSDYVTPIIEYNKRYDKLEAQYDKIAEASDVWERLKDNPVDAKTYEKVQSFNNSLHEQIDNLASKGITPGVKKALLEMKSRYRTEIDPIEQAYKTRQLHAAKQLEDTLKDDTLMLEKPAGETSLEEYINNPNLMYKQQSGAMITKRVADALKQYSDAMISTGNWKNTASGKFLERVQYTGLAPEDLQEITSYPDKYGDINTIIERVINNTGIKSWSNSTEMLPKAYAYAYEALPYALGKASIDVRNNPGYQQSGKEDTSKFTGIDTVSRYYTVNRDLEKAAKALLDERGELENADIMFNEQGKFSKPTVKKEDNTRIPGREGKAMEMAEEQNVNPLLIGYNNIVTILQEAGFTKSEIDNMDRKTVSNIISSIASGAELDVKNKNFYRQKLDAETTKDIIGSIEGISGSSDLYTIKGIEEGALKQGDIQSISYKDSTSGDILYDSQSNTFILNYGGVLYKLPSSRLSHNHKMQLENIFNPKDNKYEKATNTIKRLHEKSLTQYLTEDEQKKLSYAQDIILYYQRIVKEAMDDYRSFSTSRKEK